MVKKTVLWALVLGWMILIFSFSAQPAGESTDLSDGLLNDILNFLNIQLSEEAVMFMRMFIRKVAHFSVYCVLGVLVYLLIKIGYELAGKACVYASLAICALYAVTDEVHQLFVPGRSGVVRDVLIDTSGALCGIVLVWLVFFILSRRKKNG